MRTNKIVALFIAICVVFGSASIDVFSFFDETPVDPIALSVTAAANEDAVNNSDLSAWYAIYRGSELYGSKFNFESKTDFGIIFDKQRKIRDTLLPSKTTTLGVTINNVFKKYEDMPFDDNSKNKFIEDCASIKNGIKAAID